MQVRTHAGRQNQRTSSIRTYLLDIIVIYAAVLRVRAHWAVTQSGNFYGCAAHNVKVIRMKSWKSTHHRCIIWRKHTHNGQKLCSFEGKLPFLLYVKVKFPKKVSITGAGMLKKRNHQRCKHFHKSTHKGCTSIDNQSMECSPPQPSFSTLWYNIIEPPHRCWNCGATRGRAPAIFLQQGLNPPLPIFS